MSTVVTYKAISLDGYTTGPDGDLSRLHAWMSDPDQAPASAGFFDAGAVIMGRRTWDSGQEPWGDDEVFPMPVFVLTHERRQPVVRGGTTFTFVYDADRALELARRTAGNRPINVMGADLVRQYLAAGVIDELRLHLVPVAVGAGTPLFAPGFAADFETVDVARIKEITHMTLRVRGLSPA
jgi:dihydrofolate reductase